MSNLDTFRGEVREWLETHAPSELKGYDARENLYWGGRKPELPHPKSKEWCDMCAEKGWTAPTWPVEYGGGSLSSAEARILYQELQRLQLPVPLTGFGMSMIGPTLLQFGTEEQKQTHLTRIIRGEIRWCQGYSEPNAGSDLANLQTMAEDKGDHYVVNGQKTWTSGGQWADKCFCLVRTDRSDKHKGISFLLIDMDAPGVEVRPIQMISGASPFCETFFTDVKVPKGNLVGEEGQGWTIGKRLLQHERTNLSGGGSMARMMGASLSNIAKKYCETNEDGSLADPILRDKIANFEIRWSSFLLTARRAVDESKAQGGVSEISSVLKKVGTTLGQERAELLIEIRGLQGLGWEGDEFSDSELESVRGWLFGKATTIYGGSTEIQNNIIAKRVLGMLDHQ